LSNIATAIPNGINDQSLLQNSFNVTPNPGNGIFMLNYTVAKQEDVQITVFDNLGQSVFAKTTAANANVNTTMIDLSSLSKGVYLVQVKTNNGVAVKRLVIQ